MNPYQKIIKNNTVIQKGEMDTPKKFNQLFKEIPLKNKKVLDVGCNLGMMCQLATEQGAITHGIDINIDYIEQAISLFPNLKFDCIPAEQISGNYDIIIASAMLHYISNLDVVFELFAQCTNLVVCDIWLNDEEQPVFTLSHRNIFIPSRSAFLHIAGKYFKVIEEKGAAISPDISKRYVFHLSLPKKKKAKAILIYGRGNTGKSTLARKYFGYRHFMTDTLFGTWKVANMDKMFSAGFFSDLSRGELRKEYIDHFAKTLKAWLQTCVNKNVVIEGYELLFTDFKQIVYELLSDWDITEINLTKKK